MSKRDVIVQDLAPSICMSIRAALIAASLVLPLSVNSQEPSPRLSIEGKAPQSNAKHHQEHPNKAQRGTELPPLDGKLTSTNNANPPTQAQYAHQDGQSTTDWWMVIPTWLLSFFTLGLFIYTARLWKATGELVQESRSSLQSTQRAFVFIKILEVLNLPDTKKLIIIPQWENSGDTPTKNMLNHVNWALFEKDLPTDFDFPDLAGEERTPALIGPHAIQYASPLEIDAQHIDAAIAGTGHLYIWGWAEYDDVFPGTSRHRTEFCNEVLISRVSGKEFSIRFRLHRKHNGADGECIKKATPYELCQ
jgi:hypothetical protein